MKKIMIGLSLSLLLTYAHAAPVQPETMQQFLKTIKLEQYLVESIKDEYIQEIAIIILNQYDLPHSPENVTKLSQLVREYYTSPSYIQASKQKMTDVYTRYFSDEEMQLWTQFYQSDIGQNILDNHALTEAVQDTVAKIVSPDTPLTLSPQAELKLQQLMQRYAEE